MAARAVNGARRATPRRATRPLRAQDRRPLRRPLGELSGACPHFCASPTGRLRSPSVKKLARCLLALAIVAAVFFGGTYATFRLWNDEHIAHTVNGWVSGSLAGRGGPAQQAFTIGR